MMFEDSSARALGKPRDGLPSVYDSGLEPLFRLGKGQGALDARPLRLDDLAVDRLGLAGK
jgi:hypothetical protein